MTIAEKRKTGDAELAAFRARMEAAGFPDHRSAPPPIRTKPVTNWWGGKPLAAIVANLRVAPSPALPAPRRSKLDRNERAKIARVLEGFNRAGRQKTQAGRTDQGPLKASGVDIGKELLFGFYNIETGQLDPCDATIAKATGWSRRTVQRARERLRAAGLLSWFRRSKWTREGWKPHSNLYVIGQSCGQTTSKNIKIWDERVAASPPALLLQVASDFGVVLNVAAP